MTAMLVGNLPLIAAAPDGVKKLRALILELAVRGKLVQQNPQDEPASELLTRITAEKKRLADEGLVRKDKPNQTVSEADYPFSPPVGWRWCRTSEVCLSITDGDHLPPPKADAGIPFLVIGDVRDGTIVPVLAERRVPETYFHALDWTRKPEAGDVLLTTVGSFGIPVKVDTAELFCFQRHIALLRPGLKDIQGWMFTALRSQLLFEQMSAFATGIAQKTVPLSGIRSSVIPLPPLAEQRRIVAKVDELMALCDRLEAQQADAEATHAALVRTLLDTLTRSQDADDFAANWRRLSSHFDTIFTTEASLDALKQTLVQLAVMGKLVRQDGTDEPAIDLLSRVVSEKARLIAEKIIKADKPLSPVIDNECPYDVPLGWKWVRIGQYCLFTEYGTSEKTAPLSNGIPILKMGDIQAGQVRLGGQQKVPANFPDVQHLLLEPGDLLYNRTNSAELVGKTGIFRGRAGEYSFASYLIRIRLPAELSCPEYVNFAMNAPEFRRTQIFPHVKQQCGQANVNGTVLRNMIIPVPPLAEQHRIVAKIDELMALCDSLKARLGESRIVQGQLAATLVERAVAA